MFLVSYIKEIGQMLWDHDNVSITCKKDNASMHINGLRNPKYFLTILHINAF
jgi:hypothetical protein